MFVSGIVGRIAAANGVEYPRTIPVRDVFAAALDLNLPNVNALRAALWKRSKELEAQARHDMARLTVKS